MSQQVTQRTFKRVHIDDDMDNLEAEFLGYDFASEIITEDTDGFKEDGTPIFVYRRNCIPDELSDTAYDAFLQAAKQPKYNRGAAAGRLTRELLPDFVGDLYPVKASKYRSRYYHPTKKTLQSYYVCNTARSNIAGYTEKLANRTLCRKTAFTRDKVEKWESSLPYLIYLDSMFKTLAPKRHKIQKDRAQQRPNYTIKGTAFSTLGLNYNWRTACHKDKGDFKNGFGVLTVIERGKWSGSELLLPQYDIGFDIRGGDIFLFNPHEWHCNTPLVKESDDAVRLSIVSYLRDGLLKCEKGSKPYSGNQALPKREKGI